VDSYSNIFKVYSEFIKICTSLHRGLTCSVNMNYHNVNVISVILSTVSGHPNQVTYPMQMGPVNVSNVR
jgi:hypothetical protein